MTNEARLDEVLKWVNMVRKKYGKRLIRRIPMGDLASASSCPIARATGFHADSYGLWTMDPYVALPEKPPQAVQVFIRAFDHEKYPELIRQLRKKKKR